MDKDPAFGSDFFDREKISLTLGKRVEAFRKGYRKNLGIVGKRYIGKSTLLQNFILTLDHDDIIPVYLELRDESFSYFAKRFMGMLLVGYFQSIGVSSPHDAESLLRKAKTSVPATAKKMHSVLKIVRKGNVKQAFEELLLLGESLYQETGKKTVFVIDEFTYLDDFPYPEILEVFGRHIMLQKNVLYILSSSYQKQAHIILTDKLSLLFGGFEIIELGSFDYKTCLNYIRSKLQTVNVEPKVAEWIVRLTDGHPYYLSVLVKSLAEELLGDPKQSIDEEDLVFVLEKELFRCNGKLYSHFANILSYIGQEKKYRLFNVLLAVALNHQKVASISNYVEMSQEVVRRVVQKLNQNEVLDKDGNLYYLDDSLLKFWLKYVYRIRQSSLKVNKILLANEFRLSVKKCFSEVQEIQEKGVYLRVEDLFKSFRNEILFISKKRSKFPKFSKIVSQNVSGKDYPMLAQSSMHRWVCQIMDRPVESEDVVEVVSRIKKMKIKPHRQILIVPYGIDMDARLVAKEAKFMIWTLKDLNYLFQIFNKPKLIITQHSFETVEVIREEEFVS